MKTHDLYAVTPSVDPAVSNLEAQLSEISGSTDKSTLMERVRSGLKLVGLSAVLVGTACADDQTREAKSDKKPAEITSASAKAPADDWDFGFGEELEAKKEELDRERAETEEAIAAARDSEQIAEALRRAYEASEALRRAAEASEKKL